MHTVFRAAALATLAAALPWAGAQALVTDRSISPTAWGNRLAPSGCWPSG